MQIHNLQRKTANKKKITVGRGGRRGKTSGRGTKGQSARAGNKKRPHIRDIIKKLPKRRGRGKNIFQSFQIPSQVVNISTLEKLFATGTTITPALLLEHSLVRRVKGVTPVVKILGDGDITKKFNIHKCLVSAAAREKITKAGGSVRN